MPHPSLSHRWFADIRHDLIGGLMSAAVAIPLAVGFGMFAFVSLGDEYFADGALAGLYTAFVVGLAAVLLGDKTTTVYAPRITTTFFLGLLLYNLVHSDAAFLRSGSAPHVLAVFFAVILLGGAFQLLFGMVRLGTLIKYTPHPVMAGFQNAAALLLFLVQLGNVFGFDKNTSYKAVFSHLDSAKPLSVAVAAIAFAVMWNSRRLLPKAPPVLVGFVVATVLYYLLVVLGFAVDLGPVIGGSTHAPLALSPLAKFAPFAEDPSFWDMTPTILGGALALALIASIDALLCARLASQP